MNPIETARNRALASLTRSGLFNAELEKNDAATVATRKQLIKKLADVRAGYDKFSTNDDLARLQAFETQVRQLESQIEQVESDRHDLMMARVRSSEGFRSQIAELRQQLAQHVPLAVSALHEDLTTMIHQFADQRDMREALARLDGQLSPWLTGESGDVDTKLITKLRDEMSRVLSGGTL